MIGAVVAVLHVRQARAVTAEPIPPVIGAWLVTHVRGFRVVETVKPAKRVPLECVPSAGCGERMGGGQRDGSIVVVMTDAEVQRGPQDAD
jgi:hypothetical protein